MLPDRVSNPGPLTYESGALPIALRGPAPPRSLILTGFALFFALIYYIRTRCEARFKIKTK